MLFASSDYQVRAAPERIQTVVAFPVKHHNGRKHRLPVGNAAHSGAQAAGSHEEAAVGHNAEQGRRVLGELDLAGMAQERFDVIHAGEQRDVDLVLKSCVAAVGSEAGDAAPDARVLGTVGMVVEPQERCASAATHT